MSDLTNADKKTALGLVRGDIKAYSTKFREYIESLLPTPDFDPRTPWKKYGDEYIMDVDENEVCGEKPLSPNLRDFIIARVNAQEELTDYRAYIEKQASKTIGAEANNGEKCGCLDPEARELLEKYPHRIEKERTCGECGKLLTGDCSARVLKLHVACNDFKEKE